MGPFYGWGSTASRLEPLGGGSLLFTTKFPEIPGTRFIDLGRMKSWVDLGATQWFWTREKLFLYYQQQQKYVSSRKSIFTAEEYLLFKFLFLSKWKVRVGGSRLKMSESGLIMSESRLEWMKVGGSWWEWVGAQYSITPWFFRYLYIS